MLHSDSIRRRTEIILLITILDSLVYVAILKSAQVSSGMKKSLPDAAYPLLMLYSFSSCAEFIEQSSAHSVSPLEFEVAVGGVDLLLVLLLVFVS